MGNINLSRRNHSLDTFWNTPAKANSIPYHWRLQKNVRLPHRRDSKLNRRNELFSLNGQCLKDAHGKGLLLLSVFQNSLPYIFISDFLLSHLVSLGSVQGSKKVTVPDKHGGQSESSGSVSVHRLHEPKRTWLEQTVTTYTSWTIPQPSNHWHLWYKIYKKHNLQMLSYNKKIAVLKL